MTKHATILEDRGYITVHKSFLAKKPQTMFKLTREGRAAFHRHVKALEEIAGGLRQQLND